MLTLIPEIVNNKKYFKKIRHHFHQNPELGFNEYHTSDFIASKLSEWGFSVIKNIGITGVVGTISKGSSNKSLGFRAEMDALPIQEKTNLPYKSNKENVMHACGHDGHMASLLSAAYYASKNLCFNGTLHFIFQPSEEKSAGALSMIKDGILDIAVCDYIYSIHNYPVSNLKFGNFLIHKNISMASADDFSIFIKGIGCHAATPNQGKSPFKCLGNLVNQIIGISIKYRDTSVLSITSIQSGNSYNVIPDIAEIKLSLRTLSEHIRYEIIRDLEITINQLKEYHNIDILLTPEGIGYPVLMNSESASNLAKMTIVKYFGEEFLITDFPPLMASDDFSFFAKEIPACYINIGSNSKYKLHNSKYDFDDNLIPIIASFYSYLIMEYLV
ncbi:MAG: amidohydrolase [Providencia sp.]|jgi:hippurate hydrolase|nr:amidohydrolase [Providencia sp.]